MELTDGPQGEPIAGAGEEAQPAGRADQDHLGLRQGLLCQRGASCAWHPISQLLRRPRWPRRWDGPHRSLPLDQSDLPCLCTQRENHHPGTTSLTSARRPFPSTAPQRRLSPRTTTTITTSLAPCTGGVISGTPGVLTVFATGVRTQLSLEHTCPALTARSASTPTSSPSTPLTTTASGVVVVALTQRLTRR